MTAAALTPYQSGLRLMAAALALAAGALAAAWFFELALGYLPCKLCLWQRNPYYFGLPIGVLALFMAWTGADRRVIWTLGGLFVLTFLISAWLGAYHAGVEWKFWAGPADCGGRIVSGPLSVEDFRKSLATTRVIRCDDAALRVLGLSFAGWNGLVSLAAAALAGLALRRV